MHYEETAGAGPADHIKSENLFEFTPPNWLNFNGKRIFDLDLEREDRENQYIKDNGILVWSGELLVSSERSWLDKIRVPTRLYYLASHRYQTVFAIEVKARFFNNHPEDHPKEPVWRWINWLDEERGIRHMVMEKALILQLEHSENRYRR